jgi:hypothetical protein
MKKFGLVLLIAAVFCEKEAAGAIVTGNRLLDDCQKPNDEISGPFCGGYIAAIADVLSNKNNSVNGARACLSGGVTIGQLRDIVVQWLQRHPQHRHNGAEGLVAAALMEAFPCR